MGCINQSSCLWASPLLLFSAKDQKKERHEVVPPSKVARSYSAVPLFLSLEVSWARLSFTTSSPSLNLHECEKMTVGARHVQKMAAADAAPNQDNKFSKKRRKAEETLSTPFSYLSTE